MVSLAIATFVTFTCVLSYLFPELPQLGSASQGTTFPRLLCSVFLVVLTNGSIGKRL